MIVIPMAGRSQRFFDAGYQIPKYMLELWGAPVFDFAVASFASYFEREPFLFALPSEYGAEDFVRTRLAALGVCKAELVVLQTPTRGQADTVAAALTRADVGQEEPLTIFNIDSFRPGFTMTQSERAADGYLEVFRGEGEGWSFVEPAHADADASAPEGRAGRVLEKERISDLCSTGLYYFAARRLFDFALARERETPSQDLPEHYVAPLYNHLIRDGKDIRYRTIPSQAVMFCGVPAEYEVLKAIPRPPALALIGPGDPAAA